MSIPGRPYWICSEIYASWFEPQHFVLRRAIPFFVDRFAKMKRWRAKDAVLDALWLTYFKTIFNPARLRKTAMLAEMPKHYWSSMPETALIPEMIASSQLRAAEIGARAPSPPPRFAEKLIELPEADGSLDEGSLDALNADAACRRCPLHCAATQAVTGEGPEDAALMLVGQQPGDEEDLSGRSFVGPARRLLDKQVWRVTALCHLHGLERDEFRLGHTRLLESSWHILVK